MQQSQPKEIVSLVLVVGSFLVALACLAYPMYVIRPFRYQGPRELAAALVILQVRSIVEVVCCLCSIAGLSLYWQVQPRTLGRLLVVLGVILTGTSALLSRVNIDEWLFHPVEHPVFVAGPQVKLDADETVIAVKLGGSARAYPIRSISYHHIVNDTVGHVPIVATY